MKAIMLTLSMLLTFSFAQGHWKKCDPALLSDEALIAKVEAIADELEASNHSQRVMNLAYNRSRMIRKKLNRSLPRAPRLKDATDEDIMPLLQDIVTSLEQYGHYKWTLYKVYRNLNRILYKLENNREEPTEIAVLSYVQTGFLEFGVIISGTTKDLTIDVTNSGNGTATGITEVNLAAPYSILDAGSCADGELAPSETCTITVRFSPVAPGLVETDMIIEYNDGAALQSISHPVRGNAF